ncbi:hypothetical protein [Sphingomonas sp. BAUL-RG-20F-R05-02]|uniref:hypothetical protein n=1 Tax=Sphingomonas sp. BAUL-RG-20F-R05-02 TaxID=2914830 RepID=UPI001F565220|nr:hypothetical protein [Sphingomonas sp. BAUL-RG-20F-R05-02]
MPETVTLQHLAFEQRVIKPLVSQDPEVAIRATPSTSQNPPFVYNLIQFQIGCFMNGKVPLFSPVSPRQLYVQNTFDRRQHRLDSSDCLAVRMHPAYAYGQSGVPELDDRP